MARLLRLLHPEGMAALEPFGSMLTYGFPPYRSTDAELAMEQYLIIVLVTHNPR